MIKLFKKYKEGILYILFGILTTLVNWFSYVLLVKLIGCNVTIGNVLSCIIAVVFAFLTNKFFVFESKSFNVKIFFSEAIKFFAARGITGIVEVLLPLLLIAVGLDQSIFGVEGFAAKITSTIVVIILNYILSKTIVFKK